MSFVSLDKASVHGFIALHGNFVALDKILVMAFVAVCRNQGLDFICTCEVVIAIYLKLIEYVDFAA